MADADYDFGGGGASRMEGARHGARDVLAAARLQRRINLAGAFTSLLLIVGLGVWGYRLAVRDVNGVPVIQAMEGPMRVAPADPGGEIADHQGLAVNDVAEAGFAAPMPDRLLLAPRPVDLAPEDVSGLGDGFLPGLEEASAPVGPLTADPDLALAAAPPVESANPTEVAVDAALAEALGGAPTDGDVAASAAVILDPVVDLVAAPGLDPAPEGAILTSVRPKARPGSGADANASVDGRTNTEGAATSVVRTAEAMTTLPAPNEVDPATIAPGTRLVQFGTFDTADEARAAWVKLQGRFGEVMAQKAMVVQPAESGGRTFYRLRAYSFDSEDDARRFCSAFVAEDATCIPVPHK